MIYSAHRPEAKPVFRPGSKVPFEACFPTNVELSFCHRIKFGKEMRLKFLQKILEKKGVVNL